MGFLVTVRATVEGRSVGVGREDAEGLSRSGEARGVGRWGEG